MFGGEQLGGSWLPYTWYMYASDENGPVTHSGSAATIEEATADAKADGMLYVQYHWAVVDRRGATVASGDETVIQTPGTQGEGGAAAAGAGSGQEPTLAFRYRLTGYKWTWTSKTGDPRTWAGHGDEYDIRSSDYTYGSAEDALAAGRGEGDKDETIMRVFAESNTPGFAGLQYTYEERFARASNAAAVESSAAYGEYTQEKPLVLPEGPGTALDASVAIALGIGVLIAAGIVILGYYMVRGHVSGA